MQLRPAENIAMLKSKMRLRWRVEKFGFPELMGVLPAFQLKWLIVHKLHGVNNSDANP
jgi:hypothetical protein